MTDTLKYKATERYSFGWNDPKGLYGADALGVRLKHDMWSIQNPDFELWTNENLRNAWLIRFGSGVVRMTDITNCGDVDYLDIAILLDRRNQLDAITDPNMFQYLYKLTQE